MRISDWSSDVCSSDLYAVGAGFEFQLAVDIVTLDPGDDFFIAAVFAFVLREDFHPPAATFGVARIHAKQVAGKNCRLVAAGAGTDLEKHIATVEIGRARGRGKVCQDV